MEKSKRSNEHNERSQEKLPPSDKPQNSNAPTYPPKRNSASTTKKSVRSGRKQSENAISHRSDKKMPENITVGSLEECKKQVNSAKANSKGSGSAKGGSKSKLNKRGTGDVTSKEGMLARRSPKKD